MSRKDLLDDLATNPRITITTSSGRSYTAEVGYMGKRDLAMLHTVELLELYIGEIRHAGPVKPSRAFIERLLLDTFPALASAPPRLRAHLERHAGAIAQLVDAAAEAPAPAPVGIIRSVDDHLDTLPGKPLYVITGDLPPGHTFRSGDRVVQGSRSWRIVDALHSTDIDLVVSGSPPPALGVYTVEPAPAEAGIVSLTGGGAAC